ncbi:hypothetical protein LTR95_015893 [Oleoguttula sp. CCFEE 5521]
MPPVNSPIAASPPRIPSPYPFHSRESPPPSSSPYWTTQQSYPLTDDPRYPYPMPSSRRSSTPPPPHPSDLSRRERLQRVLARLNRAHEPPSAPSAYGNRTPSPHRQGLYDWAPMPSSDTVEASTEDSEMRRAEEELYRELTGDEMTEGQQDAAERRLWQRRLMEERARERRRRVVARESGNGESGLGHGEGSRTERMLRYVMQRERSGVSEEEERARGAGWWRPTPGGYEESGLSTHEGSGQVRQENFAAFRRGYLAENLPPRLPRISTPVVPSSTAGKGKSEHALLENALVYLSRLRNCQNYSEALEAAVDNNLATKEWWADKHDDFVVDVNSIEPLEPSHWLQPGAIFDGHQHASSTSSMEIAHRPPSATHVAVEQINPNYRHSLSSDPSNRSPQPPPFDASRPWLSHTIPSAPNVRPISTKFLDPAHDHWPVRVTLHAVDWESMTLQGTMEAYDVPQHPASLLAARNASMHARPRAGKKHAPITTFLEGHILDHRRHSFLTPQPDEYRSLRGGPTVTNTSNATPYTLPPKNPLIFPSATPKLDAQNWLALPPFSTPPSPLNTSSSPSETMARTLLSPNKINDLSRDYIHMRWKERYFIHPRDGPSCSDEALGDRDRGHGLTISGFYYVSLRRSDGKVEGLYFDPRSRPYQVIRLQGKGRGGVWEFA